MYSVSTNVTNISTNVTSTVSINYDDKKVIKIYKDKDIY